ncbi:MAG: glycosyltransferase [Acidobacteria bacterium]|nr:glycosyltransferase [Acidobacteriota bacterium]
MSVSVSIVIPCFNKRAYVAEAIESALAQTYACEVIVVDDGSTDGSLEVVRRYEGRIRWVTGPNQGGSAARNRGIELASGSLIQFLDADDALAPDKVEAQVRALETEPAHSVAFCPWSLFHDDGSVDKPDPRPYWKSYDEGLDLLLDMWRLGGFFPPHAWLVPKSLIEVAGAWNTRLTGDDDGEFFARILMRGARIVFTPQTGVRYRNPPDGSVSRNRSMKSALSFFAAYEMVASAIAARRWDGAARRACLSRVRKTAYAWRDVDEIVDRAAAYEKEIGGFDFSPSLPRGARYLIGLFGIKQGLRIRDAIQSR